MFNADAEAMTYQLIFSTLTVEPWLDEFLGRSPVIIELLPNQCLRNLQWILLKVSCRGRDPKRVALVNEEVVAEAKNVRSSD